MEQQRIAEPAPEPDNGQSWRPDGVPFPDGTPHAGTDRYVAVDRLDEDVATLIVAPWPVVDPPTGPLTALPGAARPPRRRPAGSRSCRAPSGRPRSWTPRRCRRASTASVAPAAAAASSPDPSVSGTSSGSAAIGWIPPSGRRSST